MTILSKTELKSRACTPSGKIGGFQGHLVAIFMYVQSLENDIIVAYM